MIYVESTMGYGIDSNDPDIMQVANPNDPALHTINNDGWSFPSTGEVARENEWINGKVQVLDYHKEAKVVTIRDSIKWGVRWLYHRAQSIEGPGRVWFDWKKAVERYGPLPKPSDKKLYYVDKVWNIYTRGVDPKVIKLWSIAFLLLMLGSTTFYFSMYNRPQGAELNRSQPSEGEVLSDAVYAKEWQMPSYEEARKTEPGNAMPFRMLDNIQTLAAVSYPPTNCKAGPSEYETERRLKNCTYTVGFGDSDMWIAKFKDGGYGFTPSWPPNYGDYYNVGPYGVSIKRIIQGDLNHDGYTDAVVLFEVSYQGNGNPFNVVVLIRQNDASFGQVANYAIEANAEIKNPDGVSIYWNNPEYSVSYSQKDSITSVSYTQTIPGSPVSATSADEATRQFLGRFINPGPAELSLLSQLPHRSNQSNFPDPQPRLTRLLYEYRIDTFPVILTNFDPVAAVVTIDERGATRLATFTFPPSAISETGRAELMTLEASLVSLNQGRGLLVSVDDAQGSEYGPGPSFGSVSIQKHSLVYYFEEKSNRLRPAYIFEGIGTMNVERQAVKYLLFASN